MLYNYGAAILRAVGDTKRPLVFLIISGCANALLNLFFVIICHLSVAGVGIGTVISQLDPLSLFSDACIRQREAISCVFRVCP